MEIQVLPKVSTAEIRAAVMEGREMKILPAAIWESFDYAAVRALLHETGTYVIPTEELIDYLDKLIGQDNTIEICAGNGYIGRELNIRMTDSYQQQDDKMAVMYYKLMGQPTIKYPKDVLKYEANRAVDVYHPHTVIGCYATHKWRDDVQDGNDKGVDFCKLLPKVKRLVLVGNLVTHRHNPLMELPHQEVYFDGLLTRAADKTTNRIFIWENE